MKNFFVYLFFPRPAAEAGETVPMRESSADYQILQNGSLLIPKVEAGFQGHYVCSVSNGLGLGLTKNVRITVNGESFV
jgi:hypothetical protein